MKTPDNTKVYLDLDDLMVGRTDTVEAELVGGVMQFDIEWDPNCITPRIHAQLLKASDDEIIAEQLAAMIKSTTLKRGGKEVKLTKEALMDLPSAISSAILSKINSVMSPNPPGSESSSSSSSTEDSTLADDSTSGS